MLILAPNILHMKQILLSFSLVALALVISNDAFAQPAPTGLANPIITEIMYNPPESGNDTLEFLEIYNPNLGNAFVLGGAYFSSGVEYTFPAGYSLAADSYVIISGDSVTFEAAYGLPAFEWTGGTALSNDGEGVTLRNENDIVLDTVFFDDTNAWADADATGYSLVLCNPNADNNLPESWTLSENSTGMMVNSLDIFADPGAASTCTPTSIANNEIANTLLYPNPTEGAFTLKFDALTIHGSLKIHNSLGQMVHSEAISAGSTLLNIQAVLPSGYYIVSLESENSIEHFKLTVK